MLPVTKYPLIIGGVVQGNCAKPVGSGTRFVTNAKYAIIVDIAGVINILDLT